MNGSIPESAEAMSPPKSVALITMSTRTPRVGPEVTSLLNSIITSEASLTTNLTLTTIDLATFKLPVFDEPIIPGMVPAQAQYTHDHTKAWSAAISAHDAYVLVIPEYNYGMAGATKNAIDYIKNEWAGKPVLVVSYGIEGGNTANDQVTHCLKCLDLKPTATRPRLRFAGQHGPELFAAMLQGQLGEETRRDWTENKGEEIRKAFGELRALLFEPVVVLEEKKDE